MRAAAVLALACAACASPAAPADVEAALAARARTIVREDTFALVSPYGAEPTASYADVLRTEAGLVRALFGDDGPPARVYLVAAGEDDGDRPVWVHPSRGGTAGAAFESDFVVVFGPAESTPGSLRVQAALSSRVLRHELAHLSSRRAGLVGATWLREGVALEVDAMRVESGALVTAVFPRALVEARASSRPGTLATLLAWKLHDDLALAEKGQRYAQSLALVRFLVERARPDGSGPSTAELVTAAARARDASEADLAALEPEWLAWLSRLDALIAIGAVARTGDAAARADSIAQMSVLAEAGAGELATREADELALGLLRDPDAGRAAFNFLAFFRARALRAEDVAALCGSDDPESRLSGIALRARRREPVDLEAARAALERVPPDECDRVLLQTSLIRTSPVHPCS